MESVHRTNTYSGKPSTSSFTAWFAVIVVAAVVLATAPVYAGAEPAYLTVLTPVFQWVPFVAVALLHVIHRSRSRKTTGDDTSSARRWTLWGASAVTVKGRFRSIVATSLVATAALLVASLLPLVVSGGFGFVSLRWAQGAAMAAILTLPVAIVFMIPVAGEELAWRGYLTTLLSSRGFVATTAIIGGLWAAWHLPLTLALSYAGELDGRDVVSKTVDLLFAAVLVSALRYLSGSVWPAVFAHALFNNLFQMVQFNFMEPLAAASTGGYWGYMATSWITWLIVDGLLVIWVYRKTHGRLPEPSTTRINPNGT